MQIQENRLLLEKVWVIISNKAYGFIGQAIEKTLQDSQLGDLGRGPRGAVAGEKGVSVLGYPALTRYTQQVPCRALRY
jgi:hypothetical protein